MTKFGLTLKILTVLSLFYLSCSLFDKEEPADVTNKPVSSSELPQSDTVMLGAKLQNPYSVDTMRQAIKRLIDSETLKEELKISPTHYYVRFLPLDSADMDAIYFNPDLILFPYPLDYEVLTSGGTYYRDSDLPDGQPNSEYSVVPVNMVLPNVRYEILSELYLEDTENSDASGLRSVSNGVSSFDYSLIEEEAFAVAGIEYDKPASKLRGKWNPYGKIQVYDSFLKDSVGVPGVEV
jgi:hypothetical protein